MPTAPKTGALDRELPGELKSSQLEELGLRWKLSDEARREIQEIEDNIRLAEQKAGSVLVR